MASWLFVFGLACLVRASRGCRKIRRLSNGTANLLYAPARSEQLHSDEQVGTIEPLKTLSKMLLALNPTLTKIHSSSSLLLNRRGPSLQARIAMQTQRFRPRIPVIKVDIGNIPSRESSEPRGVDIRINSSSIPAFTENFESDRGDSELFSLEESGKVSAPEKSRLFSFKSLRRARRALSLKQTRKILNDETTAQFDAVFDRDPTPLLGFALVVLLSIINVNQVERIGDQVTFLQDFEKIYPDFGREIVDDVLHSAEFNRDLSDAVGQTLSEIFGTPLVVLAFELTLNVFLAQKFGKQLVPYLLVGEAAVEAVSELAGQGLGNAVGELMQPLLDSLISKLDNLM